MVEKANVQNIKANFWFPVRVSYLQSIGNSDVRIDQKLGCVLTAKADEESTERLMQNTERRQKTNFSEPGHLGGPRVCTYVSSLAKGMRGQCRRSEPT